MEELKVHPLEDSKYDINWVIANNSTVMIDRTHIERHEPVYNGVFIVVQNPEDEEWLMLYGAGEEGFLSLSDFTKRGRVYEVISIEKAIKELTDNIKLGI